MGLPGSFLSFLLQFFLRLWAKPGLAMEREARDYSYAVALYGYLLRFFRTGEL